MRCRPRPSGPYGLMFAYLAAKPTGGILVVLIIAVVLFAVATIPAVQAKLYWAALVSAGLAFLTAAFLIS